MSYLLEERNATRDKILQTDTTGMTRPRTSLPQAEAKAKDVNHDAQGPEHRHPRTTPQKGKKSAARGN